MGDEVDVHVLRASANDVGPTRRVRVGVYKYEGRSMRAAAEARMGQDDDHSSETTAFVQTAGLGGNKVIILSMLLCISLRLLPSF